jgi:hypothetical protein
MPSVESDAQAARQQLDRILGSPGFARNERLSSFLRFVVEPRLEGRDHELKESVIAIEVLGRRPDYDPRHDPIVRTEAGRLRARLSEYYIGEGKDDALVIELPKGGYTPVFRYVTQTVSPARRSRPNQLSGRGVPNRPWPISAAGERKQQGRWHQDCGMIQFRARPFTGPLFLLAKIPGQTAAGESGSEVSRERLLRLVGAHPPGSDRNEYPHRSAPRRLRP